MIERICETCGTTFYVRPSRATADKGRYCSKKCKGVANTKKNTQEKTCPICGKSFIIRNYRIKYGTGIYCSKKCFGIAKTASGTQEQTCLQCGNTFRAMNSIIKKGYGKYCSKKCSSESNRVGVERFCVECGKPFTVLESKLKTDKRLTGEFCSTRCAGKHRTKVGLIYLTCKVCGKIFKTQPSCIKNGRAYCSKKCKVEGMRGENSPWWRGGISYEPYCPKFNEPLKERIRDKFGRKCFLCGQPENGRKLCVHHIDYDKNVLCNGRAWSLIPLCDSCHNKTSGKQRHYYFNLLIGYWLSNPEIHFNSGDIIYGFENK